MSKSKKPPNGTDYEIGRGRPPRHSQWEKGTSGNPGGKKKGAINLKASLENALSHPVTLSVDGQSKVVPACDALAMRYVDSGLNGKTRDIDAIFDRIERMIGRDQERETETSEEDLAILQRALVKFKERANASPTRGDLPDAEEGMDSSLNENENDEGRIVRALYRQDLPSFVERIFRTLEPGKSYHHNWPLITSPGSS